MKTKQNNDLHRCGVTRLKRLLAGTLGVIMTSIICANAANYEIAQPFPGDFPADNVDERTHAELYLPDGIGTVKGLLMEWKHGRSEWIDQEDWRALADRTGFGILRVRNGVQYGFDEARLVRLKGDLLATLSSFATMTGHPELEHAPMLMWGHSWAGQLTMSFAYLMPERIIGFVTYHQVNPFESSPVISYPAPADPLKVPGLIIEGENEDHNSCCAGRAIDEYYRVRAEGAQWALAIDPDGTHFSPAVDRVYPLVLPWVEDVINLRMPGNAGSTSGPVTLNAIAEGDGWLGNLSLVDNSWSCGGWSNKSVQSASATAYNDYPGSKLEACWFPSEFSAKVWEAYEREQSLPDRGTVSLANEPARMVKPMSSGTSVVLTMGSQRNLAGAQRFDTRGRAIPSQGSVARSGIQIVKSQSVR